MVGAGDGTLTRGLVLGKSSPDSVLKPNNREDSSHSRSQCALATANVAVNFRRHLPRDTHGCSGSFKSCPSPLYIRPDVAHCPRMSVYVAASKSPWTTGFLVPITTRTRRSMGDTSSPARRARRRRIGEGTIYRRKDGRYPMRHDPSIVVMLLKSKLILSNSLCYGK